MPRNTRNFWVEANIDGRTTRLEGGPVSRDGGITLYVKVRGEGGTVEDAVKLTGEAFSDGELRLWVEEDNQRQSPPRPRSWKVSPLPKFTRSNRRGFVIYSKR